MMVKHKLIGIWARGALFYVLQIGTHDPSKFKMNLKVSLNHGQAHMGKFVYYLYKWADSSVNVTEAPGWKQEEVSREEAHVKFCG